MNNNIQLFSVSNSNQVVETSNDTIINMKTISNEEYRKLCQGTIDLIKANKTINKLNILIQKKDAMIDNLEMQLKKRTEGSHLLTVGVLI